MRLLRKGAFLGTAVITRLTLGRFINTVVTRSILEGPNARSFQKTDTNRYGCSSCPCRPDRMAVAVIWIGQRKNNVGRWR